MPRHQENASGKGVCQKALFVKLRDDQWTCVSVCGLKMLRGSKVVNFTRSSRCKLCGAGCLISNLVSALRPVLVACLVRLLLVRHAACFPSLQMLFSCWFSTSTARWWITHTVCENSRNSQSKHSPELLDVNEATRVLQPWSVLHLCWALCGRCGSQACDTLSTSIITLPSMKWFGRCSWFLSLQLWARTAKFQPDPINSCKRMLHLTMYVGQVPFFTLTIPRCGAWTRTCRGESQRAIASCNFQASKMPQGKLNLDFL